MARPRWETTLLASGAISAKRNACFIRHKHRVIAEASGSVRFAGYASVHLSDEHVFFIAIYQCDRRCEVRLPVLFAVKLAKELP